MIRLAVTLESLDQLEVLLGVTKGLGLTPELGAIEAFAVPSPRRKVRSTKKKDKKDRGKPKRYSKSMEVRLAPMSVHTPRRLQEAQTALAKEFGSKSFRKGVAIGVLQQRLSNPPKGGLSNYVTNLMKAGGLVPA